ncbi:MAG: GMP synthase [Magnetococcales bacterium]|nr:GMP synthase [Magnetococcales bacterium]
MDRRKKPRSPAPDTNPITSMKIAFLHAGFPPGQLEAEHGDYLSMFRSAFLGLDRAVELVDFQVQNGLFPDPTEGFDAYLCCGSASSVTEAEPWIEQLLEFVRTVDQKGDRLVGICFGHQLVAQALGGTVERARSGWGLGVKRAGITKPQPWMQPRLDGVNLLYSHQDQVTSLPGFARVTLQTDHCPIAGFQIDNRFLTFQGHPEFNPAYLEALMEDRRPLIGDGPVDRALESLNNQTDNQQIMSWILSFLAQS